MTDKNIKTDNYKVGGFAWEQTELKLRTGQYQRRAGPLTALILNGGSHHFSLLLYKAWFALSDL